MQASSDSGHVAYFARPNRPALVSNTIDELCGPDSGVVELPLRLMWSPNRRFNLDNHDQLLWMYENVLREAIRRDELRQWINGALLLKVWHELNLPRGVRLAWELRHPQLRGSHDHR